MSSKQFLDADEQRAPRRPSRDDESWRSAPMYRGLSRDEQDEARENVIRYLKVVLEVADLLDRDPEARAKYEELTGKKWSRQEAEDHSADLELE